jgi:hypothetical protein
MRVPTGSVGALLAPGTSLTGSQVTQIGNQLPIDRAAAYAKGYGAPTPTIQPSVSGPVLAQGGVANPPANLTPQQRTQYGLAGTPIQETFDAFRGGNPALNAYWNFGKSNIQTASNILDGLGKNIASWFGGGNTPSMPPATAATQPSPTPYQTPPPSATPTPTPFKTTDARSDLLRDTEGTFYGGGHIPIPTPTPTPYIPNLAYSQPRRYSDNFGYNQYA